MSERYTHQLLKVVVAQICQTIGWNSIQSTPMELMIDILDQYLRDITRVTHRFAELYNRTDPNLDDVALAYREMGMNLGELQEYLQFVDPIERPFEVPKYPLPKDSHLNFMKPGSKEVLTRPVHIPEHMPPMLVDSEEEQEEEERRRQMQMHLMAEAAEAEQEDVKPDIGEVVEKMEEVGAEEVAVMDASQSEEVVTFKRPLDGPVGEGGVLDIKKPKSLSEERRPTREISSVIMTTSGFISPAREGRLPDSKPPEIPEEKPKPPPPPPPAPVSTALPVAKIDEKFGKKAKKKPIEKEKKDKKEKKVDKKKDSADKEKEAKSRPATPTIQLKEPSEAPPAPVSTIEEDIKPLPLPVEPPSELPIPVPDVKPPLPLPIEAEKPIVPPPVVPVAPLPKPKKEKAPRKKKQQEPKQKPQLPPMIPNPGMDVGVIFPPGQTIPPLPMTSPLVNQITPPKPPKPKRTKLTKKQIERQYMEQLQQFQGGPLNAQNILDMLTPPGKKPLPGLFQSPLFPSQKQLPPPPLPQQQQPKFPDNVAQSQLDMLQKLHPSLEITPAPGPSTVPSMHASPEKHKLNIFKKVAKKEAPPPTAPSTQGPIIVIDDDKSPPHQPQFPTTPMGKKRAPKTSTSGFSFQDTLSSPDMGFNMSMTPSDHSGGLGRSGSFREFSPPKTPSNLPKTPDIKMPSSSSSSASWMSDSGKLSVGPGPLFGDFPNFGLPPAKEEKKKKPRQPKQPKETAAAKKAKNAGLLEELKLLQQLHQQFPQAPPGPSPMDKKPLPDVYNMPPMTPAFLASQIRNPGMFGMFPLPSGPGLIPENPLFNPFNPAQSFLPPGFGMPTLPPRFDISKLLQNPRPSKAPSMESFDNLDPETKLAHTPLDLQKSTCNVAPLVPPSLQIDPVPPPPTTSRKKPPISPIVKDHLPQEHSLNLSIKSNVIHQNPTVPSSIVPQPPAAHQQPKFHPEHPTPYPKEPPSVPSMTTTSATTVVPSHHPPPTPTPQNLPTLAAASPTVPPITPGETIVIETDSDTNSQSTVTMAAMGISPPQSSGGSSTTKPAKDKSEKRKNKEHKKDKKLKEGKEGKIKKKKDKKDKNKSKDRDRERPKSSHSMNQDLSDGPMEQSFSAVAVAGALPDDPMLQEQIRRKEKKEKKKEKLKKEKRKEKERAAAAAMESSFSDPRGSFNLSGSANVDLFPSVSATTIPSDHRNSPEVPGATSVPKLMLKLGSTSTPSPRAATPDHTPHQQPEPANKPPPEVKREASPELARISALFTRPPKLKTPGSKGKSKDDDSGKAPKLSVDHSSKAAGKLDFTGTDQPAKPRPRGIQALPDTIDLFSVTPTPSHPTLPKAATATPSASTSSDHPTPHSSKKPPKEPKSSKSTSASASLGVTIPAPKDTPINVQDADGNVVWICPACGRVDDGTPMIGCDGCDAWYHWVCVGIQVPPDSNEDWYCRVCIGKKQESHGDEKQRKRKKKDKKNPKD